MRPSRNNSRLTIPNEYDHPDKAASAAFLVANEVLSECADEVARQWVTDMIHIRWRLAGQDWQEREYPDERLQEVLDRAWQRFGDPARVQGGPSVSTSIESASGLPPTPMRGTRKSRGRTGGSPRN